MDSDGFMGWKFSEMFCGLTNSWEVLISVGFAYWINFQYFISDSDWPMILTSICPLNYGWSMMSPCCPLLSMAPEAQDWHHRSRAPRGGMWWKHIGGHVPVVPRRIFLLHSKDPKVHVMEVTEVILIHLIHLILMEFQFLPCNLQEFQNIDQVMVRSR